MAIDRWGQALDNTGGLTPPRDRTKATFRAEDYYGPAREMMRKASPDMQGHMVEAPLLPGPYPNTSGSYWGKTMREEAPEWREESLQTLAPPRNRSKTSEFFDNGVGIDTFWDQPFRQMRDRGEGPY